MHIIKLSTLTNDYFKINQKDFEQKTAVKKPFYSSPNTPNESNHYAVCPACDNPVQIIGLYKQSAHTDKPYAKHHSKNIPDLAVYIQSNYDFCPFRSNRIKNSHQKRSKDNPIIKKIITELITHFDKVVYFLQKETGMVISHNLAKNMLECYFHQEGYLYYDATTLNVPIKFAHASGLSRSLYGRIIKDPKLKASFTELPSVTFEGDQLRFDSNVIDLSFCFMHHEIYNKEDDLYETLTFAIHHPSKSSPEPTYVCKKVIKFDPQYNQNLFNYQPHLSERQKHRNEQLLSLAQEVAAQFGYACGT